MFPSRSTIRIIIYLFVLLVVVILLRHREVLLPTHELSVVQVRQVDRWGTLRAGPEEKLLIVWVRLKVLHGSDLHMGPDAFQLVDSGGGEHQPRGDSPLFSSPYSADGAVEGLLVFHLPLAQEGKSLSFNSEGWDHAEGSNHQSEDLGPESGP